jgi:hypothetical protein
MAMLAMELVACAPRWRKSVLRVKRLFFFVLLLLLLL